MGSHFSWKVSRCRGSLDTNWPSWKKVLGCLVLDTIANYSLSRQDGWMVLIYVMLAYQISMKFAIHETQRYPSLTWMIRLLQIEAFFLSYINNWSWLWPNFFPFHFGWSHIEIAGTTMFLKRWLEGYKIVKLYTEGQFIDESWECECSYMIFRNLQY